MDGHSKSEVFEIFNMNLKNVIARFAQVCVLFITFACVVLSLQLLIKFARVLLSLHVQAPY